MRHVRDSQVAMIPCHALCNALPQPLALCFAVRCGSGDSLRPCQDFEIDLDGSCIKADKAGTTPYKTLRDGPRACTGADLCISLKALSRRMGPTSRTVAGSSSSANEANVCFPPASSCSVSWSLASLSCQRQELAHHETGLYVTQATHKSSTGRSQPRR